MASDVARASPDRVLATSRDLPEELRAADPRACSRPSGASSWICSWASTTSSYLLPRASARRARLSRALAGGPRFGGVVTPISRGLLSLPRAERGAGAPGAPDMAGSARCHPRSALPAGDRRHVVPRDPLARSAMERPRIPMLIAQPGPRPRLFAPLIRATTLDEAQLLARSRRRFPGGTGGGAGGHRGLP